MTLPKHEAALTVSRKEIRKLWQLYRAWCHKEAYKMGQDPNNASAFLGFVDMVARNGMSLHTEYIEPKE